MESLSKSRIQGVWDPAHSTRVGIPPGGCQNLPPGCAAIYTRLPSLSTRLRRHLHPATTTLHPAATASTRMYYIRKSATTIPPGCIASGIMTPYRRGERFNFHDQTYLDPLIALTRRISQQFCTVLRCSPEASRYVRQTSLDIFFRYLSLDIFH